MIPVIVATLAPVFSCIELLPQLHKTYTTKKCHHLSFFSLLLIMFTNILWLLHGVFILDYSLIVAGVVSLIINSSLMALFLRYRKV